MKVSHTFRALLLSAFVAGSLLGCASDMSLGQRVDNLGQQVDDQTIETKVKAALLGAPDVSGTAISVEVLRGEVQLSGFVKSQAEVQRAIELSRRVDGVTRVVNKMSVRS